VKEALPCSELSSTLKEKIKAAVVKCYDADLKPLDLSQFHADPGEGMVVYICIRHTECSSTLCAVIYLTKNS
jgi:hypothetical protein